MCLCFLYYEGVAILMLNIRIIKFLKMFLLFIFTGVICGIVGAMFSKTISIVTSIRSNNSFLLYFLPIAGVVSVFLYNKLNIKGMSTNHVIKSTTNDNELSPLLAPAVFISSSFSHLCGASVGREGAALQLGGSISTYISTLFHLSDKKRKVLVYCGMAGLFSAVFGTPFAAFIFALEVVYIGHICFEAVIPTLITSITAYLIAILLKVHPERFELTNVPEINFSIIWRVLIIAILGALLSMLFCYTLKYTEFIFKRLFKNDYFRIITSGIIIIFLTIIIGTRDYNGAGVNIIEKIFNENDFKFEAFLLKIIFTAIAVGGGYKGGEIIPTLFIGATFGSLLASILSLSPAFGAALGMTALFCGVTNCPIAAAILSFEMFSGEGWLYIIIVSIISFLLSGRISLYSAQKVSSFKDLF